MWRPSSNMASVSKKGLRVSIFALNFPPESTGIAPYTGSLAGGLTAAGFDVTAQVAHPHYPKWKIHDGYGGWTREERAEGVRVRRLLHYIPLRPRGLRRLLSEVTFGCRLVLSRWDSPRVVISVSPPLFATILVAVRLRLTLRRPRFIVWVQDLYSLGLKETAEGGEFVQRIARWAEWLTIRIADQVVVIHQSFANYLENDLGVSPSKIEVIRNWTHLPTVPEIDGSEAKERLGWTRYSYLAIHTGNMGVKQGLDNIVEAARLADMQGTDIQFILVGDGPERKKLEEGGSGISRLAFVDSLDANDYRLALAAADVLLINEKPGVSGMAVPSKLTAYFDAGRPIVAATDPNGIVASEVTETHTGLVVTSGNPAALLDAVQKICREPQLAALYGMNGRRHRLATLDERLALARWQKLVGQY